MGLDAVELVMAVEEEFSIEISNSEAEKMKRVGDMLDFVLRTLRERGETVDEAEVLTRLRAIIVEQLSVRPEEVTLTARFVQDLRVS
jgi:acyl carrier protein